MKHCSWGTRQRASIHELCLCSACSISSWWCTLGWQVLRWALMVRGGLTPFTVELTIVRVRAQRTLQQPHSSLMDRPTDLIPVAAVDAAELNGAVLTT